MTSQATRIAEGSVTASRPARPFCKWAGGKTSSLELLLERAPKRIRTYYEPMVGGGALFFALAAERRFESATIGDLNEDLVNAYRVVRDHPTLLVRGLRKMENTKRAFLEVRAARPRTELARAIRFIYLNKTAFNGLYRVNKDGDFNVPFGHYENPTICDGDNIHLCSAALRGVHILNADYRAIVSMVCGIPSRRDFVYFDPPYVPASGTANFTGFVAGGWDASEHAALRRSFDAVARKRVPAMLSNSDTKLARNLYAGHEIVRTKVRRAISCKGEGRGEVGEILVLANL